MQAGGHRFDPGTLHWKFAANRATSLAVWATLVTLRQDLLRNGEGREKRHRADAGVGLRTPQLTTGIGALDPDQPPIAIYVVPAQRAELAETQTGADRDVDETDVKEIQFVSEWIIGRELDKRSPDRIRVRDRDLVADEVLSRRKVGARRGIRENQALSDSVRQHLAQRHNDVPLRCRRLYQRRVSKLRRRRWEPIRAI